MVRPERFELPTTWFVAKYSIQLSYGRKFGAAIVTDGLPGCQGFPRGWLAEREGFEPSMG